MTLNLNNSFTVEISNLLQRKLGSKQPPLRCRTTLQKVLFILAKLVRSASEVHFGL